MFRLFMPDADIIFYRAFFTTSQSDILFNDLYQNTHWKQEQIKFYGKNISLPRLTAWVGDEGAVYKYSGITAGPEPWTSTLWEIKRAIEAVSGTVFNSVLLNLYRQKKDSVDWHSDDEPELGQDPVIGSVSLGGTRRFQFKHKQNKDLRYEMGLTHGSYLLMKGPTQHHWFHRIPKEAKFCRPRINLTFRVIRKKRGAVLPRPLTV